MNDKEKLAYDVEKFYDSPLDSRYMFVYAIKDKKSGLFDIPFCSQSDLMAKRKFIMDIRNRSNNLIGNFPDEFELYRLGIYDKKNANHLDNQFLIITGGEILKDA